MEILIAEKKVQEGAKKEVTEKMKKTLKKCTRM